MDERKEVLIREARKSDLDALVSLRVALQRHVEQSNPHLWQLTDEGETIMKKEVKTMLEEEGKSTIVAQTNEKLVGFACGNIQEHERYSPRRAGQIETIFVRNDWRRRGIGTQLVSALCRFFDSKNIQEITLRFALGNKEAENFWKTLGFQPLIVTVNTRLETLKEKLTGEKC